MSTSSSSGGSAAAICSRSGSSHGGSLRWRPELQQRLVDGEAGRVGGDLEQHPAGLAEVDRLEVLPVEDLGDLHAPREQLLRASCVIVAQVRRPERHVVHRAAGLQAPVAADTGRTSTRAPEPPPAIAEPGPVALLAARLIPSSSVSMRGGRVELPLGQGDGVQAADRVLGGDVGHPVPARSAESPSEATRSMTMPSGSRNVRTSSSSRVRGASTSTPRPCSRSCHQPERRPAAR